MAALDDIQTAIIARTGAIFTSKETPQNNAERFLYGTLESIDIEQDLSGGRVFTAIFSLELSTGYYRNDSEAMAKQETEVYRIVDAIEFDGSNTLTNKTIDCTCPSIDWDVVSDRDKFGYVSTIRVEVRYYR